MDTRRALHSAARSALDDPLRMLFDTHCHLDAPEFDKDRDEVVIAAQTAGVFRLLVPAVDVEGFAKLRECCRRYPGCLPAYGIHPLRVAHARENDLKILGSWLRESSSGGSAPAAVGEIGLDLFVPDADIQKQELFFIEQLKLARTFDLPVLLHVRRAIDPVLKCLRRVGVKGGIAHAFNGSRQQADEFMERGFCLGFGGAMTYPGSKRIRALASSLPLDAIVLETDAPDIPPAWLSGESGGRRNSPAELPRIAAELAQLRGQSQEEIVRATTANAERCLGLYH